jgi:hypothetical protein
VNHVKLFPADEHGCGHYRMRLPAQHSGVRVSLDERVKRYSNGRVGVDDADVVVFQRPMDARLPGVIEALQRQGVAVVVELDDDLAALDAHHIAYPTTHPKLNPGNNWQHLLRCCTLADLVTVTTVELAHRYAGHGRYCVLPNYVPAHLTRIEPEDLAPRADLGWSGIVPTHPHDLQECGVAIRQLVEDGHTFRVIGDGLGVKDALGLATDPDSTGWLDLDPYYSEVAQLGIGIVPLADTAFNRGKSWLKGLEYAALGVPFVASSTPDYERLQGAAGAGMLTTKRKHWRQYLRHLTTDPATRTALANHARLGVRANLTIETNAWRWPEAWDQAIKHRMRRTQPRTTAAA